MTALDDKLNEFLKFNSRPVLTHLGSVSRPDAEAYAEAEYEKFWTATIKVRTSDNLDENVPVGAGRREGVARP